MNIGHGDGKSLWRSPGSVALGAFLLLSGYSVWVEHQPNVVEAVPYLLLLACMGAHLFTPRGRG